MILCVYGGSGEGDGGDGGWGNSLGFLSTEAHLLILSCLLQASLPTVSHILQFLPFVLKLVESVAYRFVSKLALGPELLPGSANGFVVRLSSC